MKIWTTVGASLVIMIIAISMGLGGKIIGQDTKTPSERILPLKVPDQETSGAPAGPDAFDIQQDIILRLSQRIAELETAAAENAAAPLDNSTATQVPREEEKEEFVPSALPLESNPPQPSSSALPDVAADIPLADFSPDPGARHDYGEALDPYGEWYTTEKYGEVWQPSAASHNTGWAPYTNGGWHSTDLGWHFTSSDPWGWACYHYGRWIRYHDIGWCWIPGRQWAPAWVSWRISDSHIGWCPLPPSATWSHRTGIGHWVDARCNLGPSHYNFVSISNFGSGNCRPMIYDRRTNFSLILSTRNITLIAGIQHSSRRDICNRGPNHDFIAHRQGRRIPRLQIRPEAGRCGLLNRVDRDNQHLVAHRLQNSAKRETPLPRVRSLRNKTKDSGWDSIRDKDKKIKLRNHIVATAQLEDTKKSSSLPHRGRPGQADRTPRPQEVTRVTPRPLKGIGGRQAQPQKVVQRVISRDEKLNAEQQKQTLLRQRADDAKRTKVAEDARRNAIAEQQKQTLLRQRADDAKRTKVTEDARRNAIAEQQKQTLLRQRADDAKRTKAAEDARRNAIAEQQKQTLLRQRADDAKRTKVAEDARRNAIAEQQKQTLLRQRADDAKRTKVIEDARRNAIAEQQKQTLLRQRADDAKRTKAAEDARRNAIAEQQKQTLLRQRADEAKRTRAIEDARRNAIAEQQKQTLLRKRADEAKRTRAAEDARRNAIAEQQKQTLLRQRADEAKRTRAIEDARRNAIAEQQKQTLLRKRADEAKRTRAIEDARRNAIAEQQKQTLLRKRADDAKRTRAAEDARRNAIAEQQKQTLLRKRADDAKRTRAAEDARRNAIAEQQKQTLLRKRADDAKRTRAAEDARRNAIAEQQKQTLLRKRADDAKRTRAAEDARRKRGGDAKEAREITPRNKKR